MLYDQDSQSLDCTVTRVVILGVTCATPIEVVLPCWPCVIKMVATAAHQKIQALGGLLYVSK